MGVGSERTKPTEPAGKPEDAASASALVASWWSRREPYTLPNNETTRRLPRGERFRCWFCVGDSVKFARMMDRPGPCRPWRFTSHGTLLLGWWALLTVSLLLFHTLAPAAASPAGPLELRQ